MVELPTLIEAVTASIRAYPTLYRNRTDVLHFYFCVGGNGLAWINGEVAPNYKEPRRKREESYAVRRLADTEAMADSSGPENAPVFAREIASLRTRIAREKMEIAFKKRHAADLALVEWSTFEEGHAPKPIFPLSEYAVLNHVPDDVKPDWLAGVREMIFAIFDAPLRPAYGPWTEERCVIERDRNIAFASGVLTSLAQRFPPPKGQATTVDEYREQRLRAKTRLGEMFASVLKTA